MIDKKHKGALAELNASAWLLAQGYEVFRNVSPHGLVDLIGIKDGQTYLFDVKTGRPRPSALSEVQRNGNVKPIWFYDDQFHIGEPIPPSPTIKLCANCSVEFNVRQAHQKFCSSKCNQESWWRKKHGEQVERK